MTPEDLATLVGARAAGNGKWIGLCPAHRDRKPSLGIATGRDQNVLLICRTGCATSQVLKALGLTERDLFSQKPPTRAQIRKASRVKASKQRRGREFGEAAADARRMEDYVHLLGANLAAISDDHPSGPVLTAEFHAACQAMHEAETRFVQCRHTQSRKAAAL